MDINQLVYFISVAQTLNFSEAARRNYVSQSTVSRHVSDLEKEFGVQLFSRTRREVFVTNEGKTLLPYAIEMVNTFNKARTVIKEMHDGGKGKITIGCDVTSMSFPSKCLSDFGKRYPGISIELCRLDASDRAQAITGGDYDFCFMPRDMVPESSGIETLITHHEPLVIVAPHKNRFRGKSISLSELADERIVLLSESSSLSLRTSGSCCSRNPQLLYCLWRSWTCCEPSTSRRARTAHTTTSLHCIWRSPREWAYRCCRSRSRNSLPRREPRCTLSRTPTLP